MSLTTRCPKCQTTFKVVADQLKLRRGLVRCGVCRNVFPGEHHLVDLTPPTQSPPTPIVRPEKPTLEPTQNKERFFESAAAATATPEISTESVSSNRSSGSGSDLPTPNDLIQSEDESTQESEPLIGEAGNAKEWTLDQASVHASQDSNEPRFMEVPAGDQEDAVDFFGTSRKVRGFASRSAIFAAIAVIILMITLAVQLTIGARDWIASWAPMTRPLLSDALAPLGLQVMPPRDLKALTIESFELQSTGVEGLLALSALLRNSSSHRVRWPAMELSLNDSDGKVVVRRVLMPNDYLAPESSERNGIAPLAEKSLRAGLRAQGLAVTAYSVKLFYP